MLMFTTAGAAGLFLVGAQQAQAATVTAQSGDTVSELADKYGVSIDSIEKANDIDATTHLIFAGQNYEIPDGTDTTTTQAATTQQTAAQATQAAQAQQQASAAQAQQAASTVQQAAQTQQAATATTSTATTSSSSAEQAAKDWIANKESGGSYTATNGQYIGKYQLSSSYLNGDYSAANQEAVANNYVASRYGSWVNAKASWIAQGWY
ncbi:LysM peptidoglycan-binding domain-containing protein [Loigolactobacillus coryniformis]|uniref:aggregation-promoting factor n=1 Tax=Loigolactobacillus coryniformis TaxID=1610 RepID=UPI00201A4C4C|nr:LysM domain-containing protein [Loigolactobacillus coryniformis]MCL5458827.1 LysM peptidoglycan-binding domain-containing protein [Loigolactobacillus coryniformis]